MDINEVGPMLLTHQDRLNNLELILLKRGICYKCGGDVKTKEQELPDKKGRQWIVYRCSSCKLQTVKLREAK